MVRIPHKLIGAVLIALFAWNLACAIADEASLEDPDNNNITKNDCNASNPVILNGAVNGKLTIRDLTQNSAGLNCTWVIPKGGSGNGTERWLWIRNLFLAKDDKLVISKVGTNDSFVFKGGETTPGIFLSSITKESDMVLSLLTSPEVKTRFFDVEFSTAEVAVSLTVDRSGRFIVPYQPQKRTGKPASIKLTLQIQNTLVNQSTILLNFNNIPKDVLKISGKNWNQEDGDTIGDTFSMDITPNMPSDKLLAAGQQQLDFSYEAINRDCSGMHDVDKDDQPLGTPDMKKLSPLESFVCVNILKNKDSKKHFEIDIDTLPLVGDLDEVTILDGNRRIGSSMIAHITPTTLSGNQNRYLLSSNASLYVEYRCPLVKNQEVQAVIAVSSRLNGGWITEKGSLTLNGEPQKNITLLIESPAGLPILTFANSKLSNGASMMIYAKNEKKARAIAVFGSDSLLPSMIPSPWGGTMLIVIQNLTSPISASIDFDKQRDCNQLTTGSGDTEIISGKCGQTCNILVPKPSLKSNDKVVLSLPYLYLNESDCLTVTEYTSSSRQLLKICGKVFTCAFPDVMLDGSNTYLLSLEKKCKEPNITSESLSGSISRLNGFQSLEVVNLTAVAPLTLTPRSYPNFYPLNDQNSWLVRDLDVNHSLLLEFLDVDLAPGHNLTVSSNSVISNITSENNKALPGDMIVGDGALINFTSLVLSPEVQPNAMWSGRGFKLNVTSLAAAKQLVLSGPTPWKINSTEFNNGTQYIFIVNAQPQPKSKVTVIEFSVSYDNTSSKLQVVDSHLYRDRIVPERQLNLSAPLNGTDRFSSSTPALIFIYSLNKPGLNTALNLNFTIKGCENVCKTTSRCLLESWHCDGINQCGDWSDERNCQGGPPTPPPPTPAPETIYKGMSGWWLVFLLPLAMGIGAALALYGPSMLIKMRRGRYSEFQNFSDVA